MSNSVSPDGDELFIKLTRILEGCCADRKCEECERAATCHNWFNGISAKSSLTNLTVYDFDRARGRLMEYGILEKRYE